ncbi:AIPR family protein [Burkholderia cenocepacia]|uniref:AIPR family protein n=1 Tax=Burkholderia cenocepacia TaxID=95486 RepID=UPI002856FBDD|nr:AIPR family protein [Burkholderia cenocepacia]MDR8048698.1 AIPR family protein [Burkholderia cenocepacia]MDV3099069.1 AIPR family protein [Burkholderia cenocepacia]
MQPEYFLNELSQLVARRSKANHLVDTLAFVNEVAERLEEDPAFGEFEQADYQGGGPKNKTLKLHGFTQFDESDGSIGIVIGKWEDASTPSTLSKSTVEQLSGWMENFVREAIENDLYRRIAEANPAYEFALQLNNDACRINRIRLHIFTNLALSSRFKEELQGEVAGIPLERHIWDLQRLSAIYQSSREREAVEIDLEELGGTGIPCLEAAHSDDLNSYLCVIKGDQLADLFDRYGSRLLEGNVRSFLGMKGGVNKGIRSTIQDEPDLFFAYNNGISATASDVRVESMHGQSMITRLTDLQIVNGGQTTASILNARKKDKLSLNGVSVQMKLTRVRPTKAQQLIPSIAEFANTQNKVAAADFFANHPFHRKMEEISRRLLTRAKAGQRIQSKWFYERSRGQYQNERLYLSKSEKSAFENEYPPNQLISKTDLAKYANTWDEKPYWVSLGAQKNFSKFAGRFSAKSPDVSEAENWERISPDYGDNYFKSMVAVALIWKKMEDIVDSGRGNWYEGGYRANIVTYTIAKLFRDVRRIGGEIDLERIWSNQDAGPEIANRLEQLAPSIQASLLLPPPGVKNVGEWCKKEACWESVTALHFPWDESVRKIAIAKGAFQEKKAEAKKQGQVDDGIELQKKLLDLTVAGYWSALHAWSRKTNHLSQVDMGLVLKASTPQGFLAIKHERDWRKLMALKKSAEDEGFRHVG